MITLKEIAKECNVSATTVSNILNGKPKVSEETRKRVLDVIQKRGYQPNYIAQGLRNRRTRMIGIIAEDIAQFSTPGMLEGIMSYCEEKGYRAVIQNLRMYARWQDTWYDDEGAFRSVLEPALQELLSIKVDGLLYVAGHARVIKRFADFPIPVVMAYAYEDSPRIPCVVIDDEKSSYDIVKYLISMGHRKIGVLAGRADNIHTQKRITGYQRALFEEQILFNPEWVCYGDWQRASGRILAGRLVKAGVTAIYCMSDRMAGGVYDYFARHGIRVGEDISVAGFDNQDMAEYFQPALTTVDLPLNRIGHEAARILLERLEAEESGEAFREELGKREAIPCSLAIRDSIKRVSPA